VFSIDGGDRERRLSIRAKGEYKIITNSKLNDYILINI